MIGVATFLCLALAKPSAETEYPEISIDLSFFNATGPSRFIVVEKSTQQLKIFEQDTSLKLIRTFVCATGENPGEKSASGDSKTPEGVYFITEIYEDKKITVFGSRAFHLDYPNIFDKHAGHYGNGIFIHGTNKTLIPYSTNGCITLANKDLDELAPYLAVNTIPVIVLENAPASFTSSNFGIAKDDSRFTEILDYMSFNTDDFQVDNVDSLSLIALGSHAIASINFRVYDGASLQYRYNKRIYLTAGIAKKWRTLYSVEDQKVVPTLLASQPIKNQLVEKAPPLEIVETQMDVGAELLDFVKKWQTAWTNKDIDTYIDCYSPSFRNGNLDLEGWKNKKSYLNKKYDYIKVSIENIVIEWTKTGANVSFFQTYQSDKYQTSGKKLLQLVNENNRWMIQKELM